MDRYDLKELKDTFITFAKSRDKSFDKLMILWNAFDSWLRKKNITDVNLDELLDYQTKFMEDYDKDPEMDMRAYGMGMGIFRSVDWFERIIGFKMRKEADRKEMKSLDDEHNERKRKVAEISRKLIDKLKRPMAKGEKPNYSQYTYTEGKGENKKKYIIDKPTYDKEWKEALKGIAVKGDDDDNKTGQIDPKSMGLSFDIPAGTEVWQVGDDGAKITVGEDDQGNMVSDIEGGIFPTSPVYKSQPPTEKPEKIVKRTFKQYVLIDSKEYERKRNIYDSTSAHPEKPFSRDPAKMQKLRFNEGHNILVINGTKAEVVMILLYDFDVYSSNLTVKDGLIENIPGRDYIIGPNDYLLFRTYDVSLPEMFLIGNKVKEIRRNEVKNIEGITDEEVREIHNVCLKNSIRHIFWHHYIPYPIND